MPPIRLSDIPNNPIPNKPIRLSDINEQSKIESPKSIGGFISNIPKSTLNTAEAIVNPILHPIQTASNIDDLAIGIVGKIIGSENTNEYEKKVDDVKNYFINRYGGIENIKNTAYQDPVGFATDISAALSLGGSAISKLGTLTKGTQVAKIGAMPKIGMIEKTGNIISKAGETINPVTQSIKGIGALTQKAGEGISKGATYLAEREINSLIRPPKNQWTYGKNPPKAIIDEGIMAKSLEDLTNKITAKRQEIGKAIEKTFLKPQNNTKRIDISDLTIPLDEEIAKLNRFANSENKTLISRLNAIKEDLSNTTIDLKNAPIMVAQKLKQDIGDITKYTGNPTDDMAVNSALKKVYRNIDNKIDANVKGIKNLNERYANLSGAYVSAKNRMIISNRNNVIGIGEMASGLGTGIATGNPIEGIGAALAYKALGSTPFKTVTAQALSKGITPIGKGIGVIGKKTQNISKKLNKPSSSLYQLGQLSK